MYLPELTMPEFEQGLTQCRTVVIPFGATEEHGLHLPLDTDTLEALVRQGLRNLILLSGHAGGTHNATLIDAGETLLERFAEIQVAVVTEYDLAAREGRHLIETPGDSHAGEIETSRILHSHPHLVKGTSPAETPDFPTGQLVRDKRACWPGGVWGDPAKASAQKGHQLEMLVAAALERLVVTLESA
jgi:creatinine amidohydrolase